MKLIKVNFGKLEINLHGKKILFSSSFVLCICRSHITCAALVYHIHGTIKKNNKKIEGTIYHCGALILGFNHVKSTCPMKIHSVTVIHRQLHCFLFFGTYLTCRICSFDQCAVGLWNLSLCLSQPKSGSLPWE